MAYKMVLQYYGTPILHRPAAEVTRFDRKLKETARDLATKRRRWGGIGLAAPQAGLDMRLICIRDDLFPAEFMVNPVILTQTGEISFEEGCLSTPGIKVSVPRAQTVTVGYQDLEGRQRTHGFAGLHAVVAQHEIDHLNGLTILDRCDPKMKEALEAQFRAYQGSLKR